MTFFTLYKVKTIFSKKNKNKNNGQGENITEVPNVKMRVIFIHDLVAPPDYPESQMVMIYRNLNIFYYHLNKTKSLTNLKTLMN